jgi:hypothetical protein
MFFSGHIGNVCFDRIAYIACAVKKKIGQTPRKAGLCGFYERTGGNAVMCQRVEGGEKP